VGVFVVVVKCMWVKNSTWTFRPRVFLRNHGRAQDHIQEIIRILEEVVRLEKQMITLKRKDTRIEEEIARAFEVLISEHMVKLPEPDD